MLSLLLSTEYYYKAYKQIDPERTELPSGYLAQDSAPGLPIWPKSRSERRIIVKTSQLHELYTAVEDLLGLIHNFYVVFPFFWDYLKALGE